MRQIFRELGKLNELVHVKCLAQCWNVVSTQTMATTTPDTIILTLLFREADIYYPPRQNHLNCQLLYGAVTTAVYSLHLK